MIISKSKAGFTLTELLIVLGILAVIMTAVVLLLNPTEFIAQGRDSRRISDLKNIDTSLSLIKNSLSETPVDNTQLNRVYLSLPDVNGNINDDCRLDYPSLPALSGSWEYRCNANSSNLRKVDSSGWLPVSFASVSTNPLMVLPIDPVNNENNYYAYSWDSSSKAAVWTKLESQKYLTSYANNAQGDGGNDDAAFETWPIAWTGGGGGGTAALFAGTDDSIYKCLISTGCDQAAEWVDVTGASFPATVDFALDTVNGALFAGTWGTEIYRCSVSTDCDARAEWVSVFNTGSTYFSSMIFDPTSAALYAGAEGSRIYRCSVSTGCDAAGEWTLVFTGIYGRTADIVRDSINNVLYAVDDSTFYDDTARILRCVASTGCDASGEWTVALPASGTGIDQLGFDNTNGVIYAAGYDFSGGELRRCAVSTGCDAAAEWTIPYTYSTTNFISVGITTTDLYISEFDNINPIEPNSNADVHRCPLSSGCDQATDFVAPYRLPEPDNNYNNVLTFDPVNGVLYAGNGELANIQRCVVSSGCDAQADWTNIMNGPDVAVYGLFYKP